MCMGDPREIPCRMCKNGYQRDNTKKVFLKHEESVLKTCCASRETCSVVSLSLSLSLSLSVLITGWCNCNSLSRGEEREEEEEEREIQASSNDGATTASVMHHRIKDTCASPFGAS
eukprot:Tamp_29006.p1 GENE.Tamp_29006~~Tamp_29006.p1  ORF type:complete len:116 (+),score=17.82 Tamp_29006:256-603(+)